MVEATQCFVPIHELQGRASEAIVALTGAQAGCVTTGAAASLYLGTCAILAGDELAWMDALPDTQGRPNEFVVHRTHRSPYDHAVRAAGARPVEFGYAWQGVGAYPWQLEAAIGPSTAGVLFQANAEQLGLPLEAVCRLGIRRDCRCSSTPPMSSRPRTGSAGLIAAGADLIAVSGGKALRGPGSGLLAGRRELVLSVTTQHQDMYTTPELFPGPFGDHEEGFTSPGHHGMGHILEIARCQRALEERGDRHRPTQPHRAGGHGRRPATCGCHAEKNSAGELTAPPTRAKSSIAAGSPWTTCNTRSSSGGKG